MKRTVFKTLLSLMLALTLISSVAIAQEKMEMDKKPTDKMPMDRMQMDKMASGKRVGKMINQSVVDGHKVAYHILELPGKTTLHLMVYIDSPEGKAVTDAKVGYLVKGPGDKTQKVMAMAMKAAYGGDIDFTQKGKYTVKMKASFAGKNLIDTMSYETK